MLKKRIIFTLLYDNGSFMLSRNFRLQKVGDINWLQKNYNFSSISFYIDELIVLDISRKVRNEEAFCEILQILNEVCFIPIAAGGGVRSVDYARKLLRSGADKVVINTPISTDLKLVNSIVQEFGQQCVVGSVDLKKSDSGSYQVMIKSGSKLVENTTCSDLINSVNDLVGEWYINSIDKDGTGQGYDLDMLEQMPHELSVPVILAGGAGNSSHMEEGLNDPRVDAVATAHLFNFVGDGLRQVRLKLLKAGFDLANWPNVETLELDLVKM